MPHGGQHLKRTIHIILRPRIRALVVMYHLDDNKEVIFGHFLQIVGQLLHVNLHSVRPSNDMRRK